MMLNALRITTKRRKWVPAIVVPAQVALAVLAWRDLDRGTDEQVRGNKRLWRIFVAINPGNSIIYWLLGRP
jgi:hypothetical protein